MLTALVLVFVLAYAAIAFEHPLKINKSASALVGAGLLWTIYAVSTGDVHLVGEQLSESLVKLVPMPKASWQRPLNCWYKAMVFSTVKPSEKISVLVIGSTLL